MICLPYNYVAKRIINTKLTHELWMLFRLFINLGSDFFNTYSYILLDMSYQNNDRSPLWSRGNTVASHAVCPGSIPGRVSFLVEVFLGLSSTVRQMSGNLGHIRPWVSFGRHNHPKSYSSVYGRRRSLILDVVHGRR